MNKIIDFHSHILPGIDDGSESVEQSIAMLRMEAEQGITHVVATPHFYPRHDTPQRFLQRRKDADVAKPLRQRRAQHECEQRNRQACAQRKGCASADDAYALCWFSLSAHA